MLFKWLFSTRFLTIIAVLGAVAGAVLMIIVGALKTYKAFYYIFSDLTLSGNETATLATKTLIGGVDNFLIAMALLVLAYGTFGLFIEKKVIDRDYGSLSWIKIKSIKHLKDILAELIIIILFVYFLEVILSNIDKLDWKLLILPVSIILLAGALKLLRLKNDG